MLQHIQSYTGMSYMGPNSFYEPLERLLLAMDSEANLSSICTIVIMSNDELWFKKYIGRAIVRQDVWRRLVNRLHLYKAMRASPSVSSICFKFLIYNHFQRKLNIKWLYEIYQIPIRRPVVILGLNRTGTTLLHRLLAQDEQFRAPYFFEMLWPVNVFEGEEKQTQPKTRPCTSEYEILECLNDDPRLKKARILYWLTSIIILNNNWWKKDIERQARKLIVDETSLHSVEAYLPEEDFAIMRHDIQCLSWTASCSMLIFIFIILIFYLIK